MMQAAALGARAPAGICRTFAAIRCWQLKKKALLLLRAERGTEVCACALTKQAGISAVQSQIETYRAKGKSSLVSHSLQNRFGIAANTRNLLRCSGRLRSVRN
jgi:hypothetical protein